MAHVERSKKQSPKKKDDAAVNAAARKARQQARKIINALDEAEQIHQGKRKAKSFDEFLEEL